MQRLASHILQRVRSLPPGALGLMVGLVTLGSAVYLFLSVAGHALDDATYAPLGALWIIVFMACPGFFYPVEQEVARAVAQRRARGLGTLPVVRLAGILTAVLAGGLMIVALASASVLDGQLFNNQGILTVALLIAYGAYALQYLGRGVLAGAGKLNAYGALIASEGLTRIVLAVGFVVAGIATAGSLGMLIGLAALLSLLPVLKPVFRSLTPGPHAEWRELSRSLGHLISASLLSQVLISAAPLIVKYYSSADEQALAGVFVKAAVIARIPLFLFQAVQAMMLPKLSHHAASGEYERFEHALRDVLVAVAAVGMVGTLGIAVFGEWALEVFGATQNFPRADLTLLALGSAVFLLAMAASQALVALHKQSKTVQGWATGVVVFVALSALLPGHIITRVEIALTLGSMVAFVAMMMLSLRAVRANRGAVPQGLKAERDVVLEGDILVPPLTEFSTSTQS